MAFCDGCFEFCDEPALLFPFGDRFRECPLDLRPAPPSFRRCCLWGDPEAGEDARLLFAALDRDGDLLCVESHEEK